MALSDIKPYQLFIAENLQSKTEAVEFHYLSFSVSSGVLFPLHLQSLNFYTVHHLTLLSIPEKQT